MTQIKWLQWGKATLSKARDQKRPMLVFFGSPWCETCGTVLETVFSDPAIAETVEEHFVPIKVDSDRRPDLFARYSTGGWPSIAFLSSGGKLMSRTGSATVDSLRAALDEVLKASQSDAHVGAPSGTTSPGPGEVHWTFVEDTLDALEDRFDSRFGGFDRAPKFPRPESVLLTLSAPLWGHEDKQRLAVHTLKMINASPLHDHIEDGFFRYSAKRDWSSPHYEKTLETNAWLLQCYIAGHSLSGTREFMTAAREIAEFLSNVLWLPRESLFGGSQHADTAYFSADAATRRSLEPPIVDAGLLAGANALAAIGLLHLWWASENDRYLDLATEVFASLSQRATQSSGAIIHCIGDAGADSLEGYLRDQALVAALAAEIYQSTGDSECLKTLGSILAYCDKHLSAPGGPLYDLPGKTCEEAGIAPFVPPNDNALMAQAYVLAWGVTGDDSHLERARAILEGVLPGSEPSVDESALALATGHVLRPVAVETGSRQTGLTQFAKCKMAPGLAVRYSKSLENTAVVHTFADTRAPVAAQRDLERDLMLALSPRRLVSRDRTVRHTELPRTH